MVRDRGFIGQRVSLPPTVVGTLHSPYASDVHLVRRRPYVSVLRSCRGLGALGVVRDRHQVRESFRSPTGGFLPTPCVLFPQDDGGEGPDHTLVRILRLDHGTPAESGRGRTSSSRLSGPDPSLTDVGPGGGREKERPSSSQPGLKEW